MECLKGETRSSLQHNQLLSSSSSTRKNLDKHYKSSETQSFMVEIKLQVEKEIKEILGEEKAVNSETEEKDNEENPCPTEQTNDKSVDQNGDWLSSDDCNKLLVSTLRDKDPVEKAADLKRHSKMKCKRHQRHESPYSRQRSYSRDRAGRRSRSRCGRRRYDTPDRHRYYKDSRRSRSHSRRRGESRDRYRRNYSRDRDGRRSQRDDTPDRFRRSYSRDRDGRRSRNDTPDRLKRSYSRDRYGRRSRSRSRSRKGEASSGRSYFHGRVMERSRSRSTAKNDDESPRDYFVNKYVELMRDIRDCRKKDQLDNSGSPHFATDNSFENNGKSSSSSDDNSSGNSRGETVGTIDKGTVADQQVSDIFSDNSTISMLRSRIQSSLSNVFSKKFNTSSSVWLEESETKASVTHDTNENSSAGAISLGSVDDNIINTIVSRELSSKRMHSNFNCDVTDTQPAPVEQAAYMNGQIQPIQIRDPRIQRMLNSRSATPRDGMQIQQFSNTFTSQHVQHVVQGMSSTSQMYNDSGLSTAGSSANHSTPFNSLAPKFVKPTFDSKNCHQLGASNIRRQAGSAPMTYGEYRKMQESTTTQKKTTFVKSTANRKAQTTDQIKYESKIANKAVLNEQCNVDEALLTRPDKRKTDQIVRANPSNLTSSTKALIHEERPEMPRKPSVKESQSNLNATAESEDKTMNALRELINPQQLLTLVGLMEQITENNSLGKVKEALEICANETNFHTDSATKRNTSATSSTTTTSADSVDEPKTTKKRGKNELDRLHEDIDNMFIRDGVLNANGRRRSRRKTDGNQLENDAVIDREQNVQRSPPRSSLASCMPTIVNCEFKKPSKSTRAPSSQQSFHNMRKVVKNKGSSRATETEDTDWVPNKRVPCIVLKKLNVKKKVSLKQRIKNNNPGLHSLKKIIACQICDDPVGTSIISHYINNHPESEVLTSRISPEAAKVLHSPAPITGCEVAKSESGTTTFKQFCYFCNAYRNTSRNGWISHMKAHTGYFTFRCKCCSRKFAGRPPHHVCGRGSNIEIIEESVFKQATCKAYICELCNYVRCHESEMERHLTNEHDDVGETKPFKEFILLTLPTLRKGRPSASKPPASYKKCKNELKMDEHEFKVETTAPEENSFEYTDDEYLIEEEEYEFEVQTDIPTSNCNGNDADETHFQDEWETLSSGSESD